MIVGYAYVVGDIIHEGHLLHLENCKALCDKLIVGVLTDEAVMEKKPRPTIAFEERIRVIKGLECVDAAVTQETYSPLGNIEFIKPDILFESASHKDWQYVVNWPLRTIVMPYYPKESSTRIKERIREDD